MRWNSDLRLIITVTTDHLYGTLLSLNFKYKPGLCNLPHVG